MISDDAQVILALATVVIKLAIHHIDEFSSDDKQEIDSMFQIVDAYQRKLANEI